MALAQIQLPDTVERVLGEFLQAARAALGPDLIAFVLYGSAAEGALRPTSDVNAIAVLQAFHPSQLDALREPLRTAHAAIRLSVMFLLESEVPAALDAFAVKFADILQRRQVLFGRDPFAGRAPSRAAEIARLEQVLLNLTLRLRQKYLMRSLRDEQLVAVVADAAGPLRACAATILALEGQPASSPKAALERVVERLPRPADGPSWNGVLAQVSAARETSALPPNAAGPVVLRLIELSRGLQGQVAALRAP